MALQTSGQISLNDIHVEAGGTSASQASLNDADIRGLIGKSSAAQNSFNEYYGASAVQVLSGVADTGTTNTVTGLSFDSLSAGDVIICISGYNARTTNGYPYLSNPTGMNRNMVVYDDQYIQWNSNTYKCGAVIQYGIAGSSTPNSFTWNANMDASGTGQTLYALLKVSGDTASSTQANSFDETFRGERAVPAGTYGSGGASSSEEITMTDITNTHDVGIAIAAKTGYIDPAGVDTDPWSFGVTGDENGYVEGANDVVLQWYVKREEDASGTFTDISVDTGDGSTVWFYHHLALGIK